MKQEKPNKMIDALTDRCVLSSPLWSSAFPCAPLQRTQSSHRSVRRV